MSEPRSFGPKSGAGEYAKIFSNHQTREVYPMNFTTTINEFLNDESGQGITEYGAILAFVALLVAVVFSFASGTLTSAISTSFSTIVNQLNRLNSVTNNTST